MDERFKRALYSARPRLRNALKLTEILPFFHRYANGYLEDEEEKEVESLGTDVEKVDRLIRITIQKGDDAFDQFCNILKENNYETWADELRRTANSGQIATSSTVSLSTCEQLDSMPNAPVAYLRQTNVCTVGVTSTGPGPEDAFGKTILKKHHERFIECVDTKSISDELEDAKIVPPALVNEMKNVDLKKSAGILYRHMEKQGNMKSLKALCELMINETGYPQMNKLGEDMKEDLSSYCVNVPMDATSVVSRVPFLHGQQQMMSTCSPLALPHGQQQHWQQHMLMYRAGTQNPALPSNNVSEPLTSHEHSLSLPQIPCDPKYFPLEEKLKTKFGKLVGILVEAVKKLSRTKYSALKRALCQYLRPSRMSAPPNLPDDSEELLQFLEAKWDFLDIRLVQVIIKFLSSKALKDLLNSYEHYLSSKLAKFLKRCKKEGIRPKARPSTCMVMFVVQATPEEIMLEDILKMRDFLEDSLHIRPTYFEGLAEGSVVVYLSIPDASVYSLGALLPSHIPLLQSWNISFVIARGYFYLDVQQCLFTSISKEQSDVSVMMENRHEEEVTKLKDSEIASDEREQLRSMKMKLVLKEEELKASKEDHQKDISKYLDLQKRVHSAEGETSNTMMNLKEVQLQKKESDEKYLGVSKMKNEMEEEIKKMIVENNNLAVTMDHYQQMLLEKGVPADEIEKMQLEIQQSRVTAEEIARKYFSPGGQDSTTEQEGGIEHDIDREKQKASEDIENVQPLIDELEQAGKIKAQLEMEVSTLKEELDYVESCRQKQKEEYSTNLEDLKKRVHDLQLGRTKDVEAARRKIDMMEQRLRQSGFRLLWKVQQYVTRFIGPQWPALAQECAFKRKDIERIKAQYPNSLLDQIHQMFSEMEIYRKCNTVHSLMQCLRSAAYKSTHADSVLRNLAEYVFNCVVADIICDDLFQREWKKIAQLEGFSPDEMEQCLRIDPSNEDAQSNAFTKLWCKRDGWSMLKRIPLAFDSMKYNKMADHITWEVFGLSFDRFKLLMQSQSAVSSGETGVGVGSAVEFMYREIDCRGVVEWIGCMPHLPAKMKMAGIRLHNVEDALEGQTCNGTYSGEQYFACDQKLGLFVPAAELKLDVLYANVSCHYDALLEGVFNLTLNDEPPPFVPIVQRDWQPFFFPPNLVNFLVDNAGLDRKTIEVQTGTQIHILPKGSSDANNVKIYGTRAQCEDAANKISELFTLTRKQKILHRHATNIPVNMDLYDQAILAIRRKIGSKWPELARALQFDDTDIDAIKVGPDRDDLNGQIFRMIRQWEQRHDSGKGTVYELLCGLRKAVNSTGDARLKEIRDRIFTDILIVHILRDPNIFGSWHKLAGAVGFSAEEKRTCSLKDLDNKRTQAEEFLRKWCKRDGWEVLTNLSKTLEKAGFVKEAAKLQDAVFGPEPCKTSEDLAVPPTNSLEEGDAVVLKSEGLSFYGTIKWKGDLPGWGTLAGVEMEEKYEKLRDRLGDGVLDGVKYFTCEKGLGGFFPLESLERDDRFGPPECGSGGQCSLALASLNLRDDLPNLLFKRSASIPDPTLSPPPQVSSPPQSNIHTFAHPEQKTSPRSVNSPSLAQPQQETSPPSINLRGFPAEQDAPYLRTQSTPGISPPHLPEVVKIPPAQPTRVSSDPVGPGESSPSGKTSDEQRIQPLYESGDQRIYCLRFAGDVAGLLIGRGGANIRMLEEECRVRVVVLKNKDSDITKDARVVVAGTEEQCLKAIKKMIETVREKKDRLHSYTESLQLTDQQAGRVIGPDGLTVRTIETFSGAKLNVDRRPSGIEGMLGLGQRSCRIHGSQDQVESAKSLIQRVLSGEDISGLHMVYFLGRLLREMPSGMSVVNQVDSDDEAEVTTLLRGLR